MSSDLIQPYTAAKPSEAPADAKKADAPKAPADAAKKEEPAKKDENKDDKKTPEAPKKDGEATVKPAAAPEKPKAGEEKKKPVPKQTMQEKLIEAAKKGEEKKLQYKPLNGDPTLREKPTVLDPMKEMNFVPTASPEEAESADLIKENFMSKLGGNQKLRDDAAIIMSNG